MDFSLFFNHLSLPSQTEDEAYALLFDAFQGILHLNQGDDRFFLYFDGNSFDSCELAENFTYRDFKTRLEHEQEIDLLYFIQEIEDKSPFIEHISDERLDELTELTPYFKNRPYDNMDIFGIALLESGIMLSLATENFWQDYTLSFFNSRAGEHEHARCKIYNISKKSHANFILEAMEESIYDLCPNTIFYDDFIEWYDKRCKKEEKNKIKNILTHCCDNDFQLGRPIIDTLNDSEFSKMKEIRVGNAHAQSGKIRIFFAMDSDRKANVLIGFIKHSNDYSDYIKIADKLFNYQRA